MGDCHLQETSPAINTRDTFQVPVDLTLDLDRNALIVSCGVDMGACESSIATTQTDADNDEAGDACDVCSDAPPGTPVLHFGRAVAACEFDRDGDTDSEDFAALQRCYSGANQAVDPNCAN